MFLVREFVLKILIDAAPERCFDLARSMDFHLHSMRATGEKIVGGRSSGLIGLHEEVEFEARHLGWRHRLRARVVEFDAPWFFADEQVRGPFRSLRHEHRFEALGAGQTAMTDRLVIDVGRGAIGRLAEHAVVEPHLRRLLAGHQARLKAAAEARE